MGALFELSYLVLVSDTQEETSNASQVYLLLIARREMQKETKMTLDSECILSHGKAIYAILILRNIFLLSHSATNRMSLRKLDGERKWQYVVCLHSTITIQLQYDWFVCVVLPLFLSLGSINSI